MKRLSAIGIFCAAILTGSSAMAEMCQSFVNGRFVNTYCYPQPQFNGPPAFPLFRCDGQRPPIFGADRCQNWRIRQKQERLLDLQIKKLEAERRQ
jgi:hypothetical protein